MNSKIDNAAARQAEPVAPPSAESSARPSLPRPRRGSVVSRDEAEYSTKGTDELKQAVRQAILEVQQNDDHTIASVRERLLPPLMELRTRLKHGEWEPFLKSLNVKPGTFRQWLRRARVARGDVTLLLGESKPKRQMPRSAAQELAKAGLELAQAVLANRSDIAAMAQQFIQLYEEMKAGIVTK